jgi:hypothetical protein
MLPGWKRSFFTYLGKEMLVKAVLTATPTYFLTIFKMPKWGFLKIDRFRRGFLWKGHNVDQATRGHCLVNWQTCLRPKKLGGRVSKTLISLVELLD